MEDATCSVLLLAGRLGEPDDPGPTVPLLERLAGLGVATQVLCVARGDTPPSGRIVERPALAHRWQRPFAARRLRGDAGLTRPDLLHVVHPALGGLGLAIADAWKIPYVQTVDEFSAPEARIRVSRRWCRGLIATGRDLADDLTRNQGVPDGYLSVIPPGIAIPQESSATTRRGVVPVIGAAGPLAPHAGISTFLNAARRVLDAGIDAEFVIAGQGEAEADLRRRASRLGVAERLTFAGRSVIGPRFWRVLDAFCQTSLIPTSGRTLALAMAFGVPAVASDLAGLRSLVTHGTTGLLVPPDDTAALARGILDLLADPGRTRALGEAARETIRLGFDPDAEAQKLASLYRRVLDEQNHEAPASRLVLV